MHNRAIFWIAPAILLVQPISAQPARAQSVGTQQPADLMTLAQAHDRCMVTYAVRQSRDSTDDDAIFAAALQACAPLKAQLESAIDQQLPAPNATAAKAEIRARAKPNFLDLIQKIRADRARRGS